MRLISVFQYQAMISLSSSEHFAGQELVEPLNTVHRSDHFLPREDLLEKRRNEAQGFSDRPIITATSCDYI
jgi:hypothetical protein